MFCLSLFLSSSFFSSPSSLSPLSFFLSFLFAAHFSSPSVWTGELQPIHAGINRFLDVFLLASHPHDIHVHHTLSCTLPNTHTQQRQQYTQFNNTHTHRERNNTQSQKNNNSHEWKDALDPPNPSYPLIHIISRSACLLPCSYFRPFVTLSTGPSFCTNLIATTVSHLTPLASLSIPVFFSSIVSRPCKRCVSVGKDDTCRDVEHKKRGRPKLVDRTVALDAVVWGPSSKEGGAPLAPKPHTASSALAKTRVKGKYTKSANYKMPKKATLSAKYVPPLLFSYRRVTVCRVTPGHAC